MNGQAFLAVEDLVMGFGTVTAVDGVGFSVREGEHLTLLGPSGCGKTTTLRAVAGLETPRAGRIALDGRALFDADARVDVPPERRGLGMVFQSYAIWPHMSVAENVGFAFRVRGASRAATREAVERALALVDLSGFAERPATRLSGGQQQRVALARALAFDSRVVLFDEPLSNLDAQLRVAMRAELADLRRRLGFTAIYVTHDQEEAFALSDRIVVLRAGKIEQEGTPDALHAGPRTRFVAAFLGMKNVLDARVAAERDGVASAQLGDGTVLSVPASAASAIALAFRPIDVRLSLAREPGQGGCGTLVRRLFLGDLTQYTVRSGAIEIAAYDRPRPDLVEGATVHWRVDPKDCLLLSE